MTIKPKPSSFTSTTPPLHYRLSHIFYSMNNRHSVLNLSEKSRLYSLWWPVPEQPYLRRLSLYIHGHMPDQLLSPLSYSKCNQSPSLRSRPFSSRLLQLASCWLLKTHHWQKAQNSAARLVFRAKKLDHITLLLHSLHWLPVQARIEYKLSVLCHNFFSYSCPSYLADLLSVYSPFRTLRSADTRILKIPVTRTKTYGQRAFAYSAPKQWNSLSSHIRRHSKNL